MPYKLFLTLIGLTLTRVAVLAGPTDAWQLKAKQGIDRLRQAELWVGGAVGVEIAGLPSIQTYADTTPGSGVAPSQDSVFEIGSLSKAFTGILLAQIASETPGMSVDDPVSKFLPEFSGKFAGNMTLRQLGTHTSGLPRMPCADPSVSFCFHPQNPKSPYEDYTATQLTAYLLNFTRTDPGPYPISYSNTGFAFLGYILTRVTRTNFDNLLSQRITRPLSMIHTLVERPRAVAPANFLKPFDIDLTPVSPWPSDVFAPTGGILSTPSDMMKFMSANLNPASDSLSAAMKTSQAFGLGWDSKPGSAQIFKNGETGGFHGTIFMNPSRQEGIFVLANIGSQYIDNVAFMPLNIPMPDLMGIPVPAEVLSGYLGTYQMATRSTALQVTLPDHFLIVNWNGKKFRLDALSNTDFNVYDGLNPDGYHKMTFAEDQLLFHFNEGNGKIVDLKFRKTGS